MDDSIYLPSCGGSAWKGNYDQGEVDHAGVCSPGDFPQSRTEASHAFVIGLSLCRQLVAFRRRELVVFREQVSAEAPVRGRALACRTLRAFPTPSAQSAIFDEAGLRA